MTVTVPGKPRDKGQSYQHQSYPQCVYGESLEDVKIINSAEEMPDGYRTYDEFIGVDPKEDAKAKKADAKKAEKEYRQGIMEYLDEHDVDYAKNLSTSKLEELKVALDDHLAAQDQSDDAE